MFSRGSKGNIGKKRIKDIVHDVQLYYTINTEQSNENTFTGYFSF